MTVVAVKKQEGEGSDHSIDSSIVEEYVIFLDEKKAKSIMNMFDNMFEKMVDHIEINDDKLLIMNPKVHDKQNTSLPDLIKPIPRTSMGNHTTKHANNRTMALPKVGMHTGRTIDRTSNVTRSIERGRLS